MQRVGKIVTNMFALVPSLNEGGPPYKKSFLPNTFNYVYPCGVVAPVCVRIILKGTDVFACTYRLSEYAFKIVTHKCQP